MTDTVEDLDTAPQGPRSGGGPPIRVVFAKGGLDAHERGAHVVVLGLREAGFEVVYMGLRRTPEEVVRAAVQEDADVIGVSSLSGGHRGFVHRILELLHEAGATPVVVVGGLIPDEDQSELLGAGVDRIFGQGALVSDIAEFLRGAVAERRRARA
ncbi:MAG: cobalamin-dependent protein [Actinomycetota bacterium]|jgi:methylmalonyl-CoA mutase C-terminal domain/subunit|nr:cobalamin-dependent protein [Actinomycetota bacterium]